MSKKIFLILLSALILIPIIFIWIGNISTLHEISILEKEVRNKKQILEDKEKELDKKIIEYDNSLDLAQIRENMEKKGMNVANDIVYFEIGE